MLSGVPAVFFYKLNPAGASVSFPMEDLDLCLSALQSAEQQLREAEVEDAEQQPRPELLLSFGEVVGSRKHFLVMVRDVTQLPAGGMDRVSFDAYVETVGLSNMGPVAAAVFNSKENDAAALWLLKHAAMDSGDAIVNYNLACVKLAGDARRSALRHLRRAAFVCALSYDFDAVMVSELAALVRKKPRL